MSTKLFSEYAHLYLLSGIDMKHTGAKIVQRLTPNLYNGCSMLDIYKPYLKSVLDMEYATARKLIKMKSDVFVCVRAVVVNHPGIDFEATYGGRMRWYKQFLDFDKLNPEQVRLLCDNGYDIFGLVKDKVALKKKM